MATSSKTTSQRKGASKKSKKVKIQTKAQAALEAQAKAQADQQSTDKPHVSLSLVTPPDKRTEMLEEMQNLIGQQYPEVSPEEIILFINERHFDQLSIEQLLQVLSQILGIMDDCTTSFAELYANYQDFSELLQDFQTLIEEKVAQIQEDFYYGLKHNRSLSLADKYANKLVGLHIAILYVEELLEKASKLTGDTKKYKLNLRRTRLCRDLPVIYADDVDIPPDPEVIIQFVKLNIKRIFALIQRMVARDTCEVPLESYQSYLQEVHESINEFVLPRAQSILDANDKYSSNQMTAQQMYQLISVLNDTHIKDPKHIVAYPFEVFLADEELIHMPCTEDAVLVFPNVLRIQLKYAPQTLQHWCDVVFRLTCSLYEFEPKDFTKKMSKIRKNRLKANGKEQSKLTSFVQKLAKRIHDK